MEIEPISRVGGAASPTVLPAAQSHSTESPPVHAALVESLAVESETIEQRADSGDLMALEQLADDETQMTPVESQQLHSSLPQHAPGAHEPGKGDIIDIYD